jgi:hypothetical protein
MRSTSPVLALLLAPILLAACAGADDPGTSAADRREPAEHGRAPEADDADPYGADPELARRVADALDTVLAPGAAGAARDDLRVFSECWLDDALYQVELFGGGVGVWNGERQFEAGEERVNRVLELLREARFGDMREVYGEAVPDIPIPQDVPPADGSGAASATRVLCLVALRIGDVEKQTIQISKPPRSEALMELAESIFELCREPAMHGGVTADGVDDGLAKVADGTLAPETLSVLVQRKPEPRDAEAGAGGFLLRIDGGRATVRDLEATGAFGPPRRLDLDGAELAALAGRLAEARIGEAPPNLWAEHYTDVMVGVLDQEQRIQARRFARMTPRTHGEAQVRYDAVYRELEALGELTELTGR